MLPLFCPSSSKAQQYNNRGFAFSRIGAYDKAVSDYSQLLKYDIENREKAKTYNNRG
jgi:tetratricopeptide (TPR) repeat protein